jgi:5-formyltetrahydrofolate cyclo-ligase
MLKSDIRTLIKTERNKISDLELNQKSQLICEIAFNNFNFRNKTVSIFLPISKFKEVNTHILINRLKLDKSSRIAVPKSNFNDNSLKHYLFSHNIEIEENKFGIPEPNEKNIEIKSHEFDIVFVPLMACDMNGHRVGYGKGFYDRFIKKCNDSCLFIGLNIFDEQMKIDDIDEFDIPLDYCITPHKLIKFKN